MHYINLLELKKIIILPVLNLDNILITYYTIIHGVQILKPQFKNVETKLFEV